MAKGYWVAHVDVDDVETYQSYVAANAAPLAEFGGRFLVRGGQRRQAEGTSRARTVVIEFDSYETALACYESPGYQAALALRAPVATSDLVIIEGYDP
ncbi:MAG: DUF1330 domain-containing protein [Rhodobacteraceae bacterium]|nr:DUF1330 domain-containing protein [Paracoccaceae bacterium]